MRCKGKVFEAERITAKAGPFHKYCTVQCTLYCTVLYSAAQYNVECSTCELIVFLTL